MANLKLKACPRCRGDLAFTQEQNYTAYSCIQCGGTFEEEGVPPLYPQGGPRVDSGVRHSKPIPGAP